MLSGVFAIILLKQVMKRNSAIGVTFWTFLIGSLGFIPFFLDEISKHGFLKDLSLNGYFGLMFGIVFASLLAYFLRTFALKILTASNVSIFTYIDPVVTLLVAAPLLGERPTPAFVIGSLFVIIGIFKAEGRLHWHPIHLVFRKKQPSK
jgi:drug/metabolite transporter (DMT)-like permease